MACRSIGRSAKLLNPYLIPAPVGLLTTTTTLVCWRATRRDPCMHARRIPACSFSCNVLRKRKHASCGSNDDTQQTSTNDRREEHETKSHDQRSSDGNTAEKSDVAKKFYERRENLLPRRAVMYVPGNDMRKIEKLKQLHHLDCIVLDHEDGVAESAKNEARNTIRQVLDDEQLFSERRRQGKDIGIRINSVCLNGERALEDLRATLHARNLPTSIFLPKVEHEEEVQWILEHAWALLHDRPSSAENLPSLRLVLYIESAVALLRAHKICKKALKFIDKKLYQKMQLDALVFGADDYIADIDAQKTADARECLYARQHLVNVAKAYKLQCIDMVWIDYKDADGLRRQADEGRQFGFTGKQIIHPNQIETVQAAFSPSPEQIEWAEALLAAYEVQSVAGGRGAFTFRDKMIDRPLILQARNILLTKTRL